MIRSGRKCYRTREIVATQMQDNEGMTKDTLITAMTMCLGMSEAAQHGWRAGYGSVGRFAKMQFDGPGAGERSAEPRGCGPSSAYPNSGGAFQG